MERAYSRPKIRSVEETEGPGIGKFSPLTGFPGMLSERQGQMGTLSGHGRKDLGRGTQDTGTKSWENRRTV